MSAKTLRHGDPNRYKAPASSPRRCRCPECREGHRLYVAERRAEALAAGTLAHGKGATADAGCKCSPCVEAKRARNRAEYRRNDGAARRREENSAIERLDVARCPKCHSYHDADHQVIDCVLTEEEANAS